MGTRSEKKPNAEKIILQTCGEEFDKRSILRKLLSTNVNVILEQGELLRLVRIP